MKTKSLKENLVDIMKKLVEQLNKASEAYYSGHAEIMSDKEWNSVSSRMAKFITATSQLLIT